MKMPKNRTGALLFVPTHRIRLGNQKQQWGGKWERSMCVWWVRKAGQEAFPRLA